VQAPATTGSKSVFLLAEKRATGILQTNASWVNTKCELSLSLCPSPPVPPNCTAKRKMPLASTSPHPPTPPFYLSYSPSLSRCIKATLMTLEASRRTQGIVITKWQAHIHKKSLSLCSLRLFYYHHRHREIGFVQENPGTSYPPNQTTCRTQIPLSLLDVGEIHSELVKFASVLSLSRCRAAEICFFILKCLIMIPWGTNIHPEYEFVGAVNVYRLFNFYNFWTIFKHLGFRGFLNRRVIRPKISKCYFHVIHAVVFLISRNN